MKELDLIFNPEFQVWVYNHTEDDSDCIDIVPEKDYSKLFGSNISVIDMENGILTIETYAQPFSCGRASPTVIHSMIPAPSYKPEPQIDKEN